jgi:tetratricopeptide (TPR) repeat protein
MMQNSLSRLLLLLTALVLAGPAHASDADYRQGLKDLESNDLMAAVQHLESAVAGDPDNVRYANDYRMAVIRSKQFDRSLQFFEKLAAEHPKLANLHLNFGFAYVDKIPAAGSITQVILANNALNEFSKAVELDPSWIAYYTRGASYLFWPKIFNRAPMGVADLEKALAIVKKGPRHTYYAKTYIAMGDGLWKTDQLEPARTAWQEGLKEFPDNPALKTRLSLQGDELKKLIEDQFDPSNRVDTNLRELWAN